MHCEVTRAVVCRFMVEIYGSFTAEVGSAMVGEVECEGGARFRRFAWQSPTLEGSAWGPWWEEKWDAAPECIGVGKGFFLSLPPPCFFYRR